MVSFGDLTRRFSHFPGSGADRLHVCRFLSRRTTPSFFLSTHPVGLQFPGHTGGECCASMATILPRSLSTSFASETHFCSSKPRLELPPMKAEFDEVSSFGCTPRFSTIAQTSLSGYKRQRSGRTDWLKTGGGRCTHWIGTISPTSPVCQYRARNHLHSAKAGTGTAVINGTLFCLSL